MYLTPIKKSHALYCAEAVYGNQVIALNQDVLVFFFFFLIENEIIILNASFGKY